MGLNERGLAPVLLIVLALLVGFLGTSLTGLWDPGCLQNKVGIEPGAPDSAKEETASKCRQEWDKEHEPVAPPRPGAPLPPPGGATAGSVGASAGTTTATNNVPIDAAALRKAIEQKIGGEGEAQVDVEKALAHVQLQHTQAEVQANAAKWPWPKQVEIFVTEKTMDFTTQVPLFRAKPFTITGDPNTLLYEWAMPVMTDDGTASERAKKSAEYPEVQFVADALHASQDPGYEASDATVPESYERALVAKPEVRVLPGETAAHYFSMKVKDPDNDLSQFGNNPFVLEIMPNKEGTYPRIYDFFSKMKENYSPVMNVYTLLTPKYGWGNEKTSDYADTVVLRFTLYVPPDEILRWMSQVMTDEGKLNPLKEVHDCLDKLSKPDGSYACLNKLKAEKPALLAAYRRLDAYRMQWSMTGGKPVDLWSYTYNREDYPFGGKKIDSRIEVFSSRYPNKASQSAVWVMVSHPKSTKNPNGTYTPVAGAELVNRQTANLEFINRSEGPEVAADNQAWRNDIPWPRWTDSLIAAANFVFPLPDSLEAGKAYRLRLQLGDTYIGLSNRDPTLKTLDTIQPTAYTVTYADKPA